MTRIALASDETTVLTEELAAALREAGHEVELHGPPAGGDEEWVDASAAAARAVAEGRCERAVVCCWSGTGASIAANKVAGARAALCVDAETARMARRYNHANVLALSLRITSPAMGREILEAFLAEPDGAEAFDLRNVERLRRMEAEPPPA
ncbi:RpiB/LacA/LacB family sugar-phosphate isomerase [Miltoncostaea marina]|uniref:RpiB/LacA/LacB family sugar-phosphate isomerase n=1 Tax=Miltoncostaea marina TaxID=2843215 RepID=UPI001C3DB684|nr:RpiB/LacA/LacB family sugar-phosphate isomerase [Miltoncostaea marina]